MIIGTLNAQILEKIKHIETHKGFFDYYIDKDQAKLYLEVPDSALNQEFLYLNGLATGVGSNDIGLDRGQIGREQVVYFKKVGDQLFLVQPNLRYRATTDNPLEKQSVKEAFATSVLFGFKIKEVKTNATKIKAVGLEQSHSDKFSYVIDLTKFLMQDAHGVVQRLASRKQGAYKLDFSKSALALEGTKNFPDNSEFEAMLTFKGSAKGREIRSVAPNPGLVTVHQHHSFIRLPDTNYVPRAYDPRSGALHISYADYATPIHQPIVQRWILRHRLQKANPKAEVSPAIQPIVYYLDNGTPEPVRSALLEGARWWNEAFENIGFENAYQVKILPDDADPMDVRYNVIQWVHRSTRGWSYGRSVIDPRTGEIIKVHVSLGSLRIRQDFLIAQALSDAPYSKDKNIEESDQQILSMALARIRQLSAHEVGHTLGFAHNFAASTHQRASVMDYPHPLLKIKDGKIDFSQAYDQGIGLWDKYSVAYSYATFDPKQDESKELKFILTQAQKTGLRYISDQDARPLGGSHAMAHLWDNDSSAVQGLKEVIKIRTLGIQQFSKDQIKFGQPYTVLEDVFVPLYFFHRYQSEAVVKLIGGMDYNYALKGDGQLVTKVLDKKQQKRALATLLTTIEPKFLTVPQRLLDLFPPRALGYYRSRESFKGYTGVAFDALSAAGTASEMVIQALLHPQRASRLVHQKAMDRSQLGLAEVIQTLLKNTIKQTYKAAEKEVAFVVQTNVLRQLMKLHQTHGTLPQVQAVVHYQLLGLKAWLARSENVKKHDRVHLTYLRKMIDDFVEDPSSYKAIKMPKIPDGSPIGSMNHAQTCGWH